MTTGRPRTAIGTYGSINVRRKGVGGRYVAETRFRDLDGQLRQVKATGASRSAAMKSLRDRLLNRPGYGSSGLKEAYANQHTLQKPFNQEALEQAIRIAFG